MTDRDAQPHDDAGNTDDVHQPEDVYKRQPSPGGADRLKQLTARPASVGHRTPVSYTHLDVYKRQVLEGGVSLRLLVEVFEDVGDHGRDALRVHVGAVGIDAFDVVVVDAVSHAERVEVVDAERQDGLVPDSVDDRVGCLLYTSWTGGDCHIYSNHTEQVSEQLSREPYPFPRLELAKAPSMFEYSFDDISVTDYQHHPTIKAPVAV